MRRRSATGFTLMEMLVVVAIIAVLAAIAIPLFTSHVASARSSVCQANRRSLLAAFETRYMSDVDAPTDDQMNDALDSLSLSATLGGTNGTYTITGLCPEDGTVTATVKDGVLTTRCSIEDHNGRTVSFASKETMDTINDVFKTATNVTEIRDNGTNTTPIVVAALAEKGLSLQQLGAESWLYRNVSGGDFGNKLYWTSTPVPETGSGRVYAMSYNFITEHYVVWQMTYSNGALRAEYGKAFGPVDGQQTYENAIAIYNEQTQG